MFSSRICINYLTLDAKIKQQSINQTNKMVVRQHVTLVTDDKIMTFEIQVLTNVERDKLTIAIPPPG
jgi:hypothetical protein